MGAWAVDYFHLFQIPLQKLKRSVDDRISKKCQTQVELSKEAIGAIREDVNIQSRKGK